MDNSSLLLGVMSGTSLDGIDIVLIDQKQRIRAFYDGTDEVQMQQAIQDIEILKKLDN